MTALRAGLKAFTDPESQALDYTLEARNDMYAQAWAYYRSTIFSKRTGDSWVKYLSERELYKHTRLIYNPVPQIVDFYVDNIWRPAANDQFESLITPVADGTDDKLIDGIAQLDQWTNFLAEAQKIKRYAAATGNVLIEVVDALDRQKVLQKTVWPGHVSAFDVNNTGDLQSYTLEYPVFDKEKQVTYQLKKIVTKETISWFRDNVPFVPAGKAEGVKPVEDNPYGFCPAVLIKHCDDGGGYGGSACKDFNKVDEVNSLASHLHDNIHKLVESPVVIATDGTVKVIAGASNRGDSEIIDMQDPRLHWLVLKAPAGASVLDIASKLKLAESHPFLKDALASFHDDYPELQAATIIKEHAQLSGAALERMLGPAQNRLNGVQPFYNQQLIKLRQMQLAIAGYRVRNGWSNLTDQQRKFGAFDLQSYENGKLDFNLKSSILVQTTAAEDEELLLAKAKRTAENSSLVDLGQMSLKSFVELREVEGQLPDKVKADEELKRIEDEAKEMAKTQPVINALNMPNEDMINGDPAQTNNTATQTEQKQAA